MTHKNIPAVIPEHFVPSSSHAQWRGKIRCAYCKATGWSQSTWTPKSQYWWGLRHGNNCKKYRLVIHEE